METKRSETERLIPSSKSKHSPELNKKNTPYLKPNQLGKDKRRKQNKHPLNWSVFSVIVS